MKLLLAPLLFALSGCGLAPLMTGIPPAPVATADRTILDEQAAISVELAYQAAAQVILVSADAGLLKDPALRARVRNADSRAYAGVQAVREAYRAGNATSYRAALSQARGAISDILIAVKGS